MSKWHLFWKKEKKQRNKETKTIQVESKTKDLRTYDKKKLTRIYD